MSVVLVVLNFGLFRIFFYLREEITSSEIRSDVTFVKYCSKYQDVSFEKAKCGVCKSVHHHTFK
jgi:hypothetical protein